MIFCVCVCARTPPSTPRHSARTHGLGLGLLGAHTHRS